MTGQTWNHYQLLSGFRDRFKVRLATRTVHPDELGIFAICNIQHFSLLISSLALGIKVSFSFSLQP